MHANRSPMSRHIVADVSTHHTVARRGFEPLTSSLKGKRPGPLGDRAAPQGYGRGSDDAALPGALRFVHRLIHFLDDRIGVDVRVGTLGDPDGRTHVHRLTG